MLPTTTVALTIRVDNDYAHGPTYTHLLNVDVPIPGDDINLTEWMLDHLFPYTGEGPEYADSLAIYSVQIISAPNDFDVLLGLAVSAMG
ncbi:hypothetical protein [Dietzia timorensis]|uniref:Uncharacterized protein n=1 Tax=Dietzia timorensis TaxID=499555 RepID=A0A173LG02_9ACTN|nr:hypothetical protein [Dietzia timorensis]ANI91226.1 Hypothetical protein BJL86_0416 [Dietzia timorensis]